MPDLLNEVSAARDWANDAVRRHQGRIFGELKPAVIWSDARGDDGQLLVPANPAELVERMNRIPMILLHNHDPGRPKGQLVEAAHFETSKGQKFIAAVLGFYAGGDVLTFRELGLDTKASAASPSRLPAMPDGCWIELATDPKEVDGKWLDEVTSNAPLRIKHTELSHNAADSAQELIRVGLVYLALVWNPFVTSIASEAGKGAYAAIHNWLRTLLTKLSDRRNPILVVQSHQDGCDVQFLFRGKDVKQHYAAHDAFPGAAAQAATLIAKLKERDVPARQLNYEFDKDALAWHPSYAVLTDGRIITDSSELIAIENLPTSLSLGLSRGEMRSQVVKAVLEDDIQ